MIFIIFRKDLATIVCLLKLRITFVKVNVIIKPIKQPRGKKKCTGPQYTSAELASACQHNAPVAWRVVPRGRKGLVTRNTNPRGHTACAAYEPERLAHKVYTRPRAYKRPALVGQVPRETLPDFYLWTPGSPRPRNVPQPQHQRLASLRCELFGTKKKRGKHSFVIERVETRRRPFSALCAGIIFFDRMCLKSPARIINHCDF